MAGHSKWAQIRHKKALTDAKRGKLFSKIVREIAIAVREKGPALDSNLRLRSALDRAKDAGMPKENMERAIERASGRGEAAALQEFLYEAVGPGGVHILIGGITDNKNRALSEIKKVLLEHDAKLVPPNSLLWSFEKAWTEKGRDYLPKTPLGLPAETRIKIEELLAVLLDHEDVQEVYTNLAG